MVQIVVNQSSYETTWRKQSCGMYHYTLILPAYIESFTEDNAGFS